MNWNPRENFSSMPYPTMNIPSNINYYSNSDSVNITYFPYNTSHNPVVDNESFEELKKNDQNFIDNFMKVRGKHTAIAKPVATLKIHQAKKYLFEVMAIKKEIEFDIENLNVNSEDFDLKWMKIINKKKNINNLLLNFTDENVAALKIAVQKRVKKRVWKKKQKLKKKELKVQKEKRIQEKHVLIDKLLSEKSKEVEAVKRKEALKRQADSVLHEVRKKKYEAKKMLNMLGALLKLRELRSQQEIAQGGYCSEHVTETFKNVINHFQDLWNKQSQIYNLEEKGLRVMLEESEIPQLKISNFQKILNQWEQALFGTPSTDDNFKFLTAAEDDINALVCVRREWDQYLTDHSTLLSSCIPAGWVVPSEHPADEWKSFIRTKKKAQVA